MQAIAQPNINHQELAWLLGCYTQARGFVTMI